MTVLNFPDTTGQATDGTFQYTENNVTYSWDGTKWTANTADALGNVFLRLDATNDPVTGNLEIGTGIDLNTNGTADFAGGITLSGDAGGAPNTGWVGASSGTRVWGYANGNQTAQFNGQEGTYAFRPVGTNASTMYIFNGPRATDTAYNHILLSGRISSGATITDWVGLNIAYDQGSATGTITNRKGIHIDNTFSTPTSAVTNAYGIYSELAADGNKIYNFYAAGTAPNYFDGELRIGTNAQTRTFISNAPSLKVYAGSSNQNGAPIEVFGRWITSNFNWALSFSGATSASDETPINRGGIRIINAGVRYNSADGSPVRIAASTETVSNVTALSLNASNVVKLLQPKQFELGGRQQLGFLAPEIEPHLPLAVEENVDEEAGTTEKEYDPLALIPILTKALQEALTRLEAIEANEVVDDATDSALLTLVAGLAERVTALESA